MRAPELCSTAEKPADLAAATPPVEPIMNPPAALAARSATEQNEESANAHDENNRTKTSAKNLTTSYPRLLWQPKLNPEYCRMAPYNTKSRAEVLSTPPATKLATVFVLHYRPAYARHHYRKADVAVNKTPIPT
jgi:hypothetical protein